MKQIHFKASLSNKKLCFKSNYENIFVAHNIEKLNGLFSRHKDNLIDFI